MIAILNGHVTQATGCLELIDKESRPWIEI